MSDLINPQPTTPAPSSSSELTELKAMCGALEAQTQILRIVLLLVVGALCLFFWREAGFNSYLAVQMQPQVSQISQYMAQLEKQGGSFEKQIQGLQSAVQRLGEYAKTHPDYAQVLAKHGLIVSAPAPAPAAAKPAAAPAKK
jgi:hypothetical protein